MNSDSSDDELLSLKKKVESLSRMLGTMHEESNLTINTLEKRLQSQQTFNSSIVKLLEENGLAHQLSSVASDMDNSLTQDVQQVGGGGVQTSSSADMQQSKSNSSPVHHTGTTAGADVTTDSFTQTNLAIDPETSVKLSFISAGISSYGSSIEYSTNKHTITSTPASSNQFRSQSHGYTEFYGSAPTMRTERISPTSLNREFLDRNSNPQEPSKEYEGKHTVEKQPVPAGGAGRPPTFPSTVNTPSKQGTSMTGSQTPTGASSAPLKSILRTPTHEKPTHGGPLSSFSPALSPIQSLMTNSTLEAERQPPPSPSIFDDSHVDEDDRDDSIAKGADRGHSVNLGASLFMSPLHYDSSDVDGSLQSLSMLNVTTNTTLASVPGQRRKDHDTSNPHHNSHSRSSRRKKSPARRGRRTSSNLPDDPRYNYRDGGFESPSVTSGEDRGAPVAHAGVDNGAYSTPTKDAYSSTASSVRSSHTTGYNKKRVSSMGFVKLQHFTESKRTSSFWKERLGKRDLTSVLSSPLSQKLF